MRDFKKLKIWVKGMEIVKQVYQLTSEFPELEKFGLRTQMNRAAVSIPSNIAEGSAKRSDKEYIKYLEVSLGSAYELETQVLIASEVSFGKEQLRESLLKELDEEQKMIQSFIRKIEGNE
jgi:four helix bundle protein